MPLPLPNLDTRRWADLVDEGRALIPRYAPGWTDHNAHDPGIALIELLAYFVEQEIYRVNRVPPAHRRRFLALAGFPVRAPQPAVVPLAFSSTSGMATEIPAGFTVAAGAPGEGACPALFRTRERLTALPIVIISVQSWAGGALRNHTRAWSSGEPFAPWGDDPSVTASGDGPSLVVGFDAVPQLAAPVRLWIGLAGGRSGQEHRGRILEEDAARLEACRPPDFGQGRCNEERPEGTPVGAPAMPRHHGAAATWEYVGAGGRWTPLTVGDETRALSLDGFVSFAAPGDWAMSEVGGASAWFVRCRLESGRPDIAPTLSGLAVNVVAAEQAMAVRSTLEIVAGASCPVAADLSPGTRTRLAPRFDGLGRVTAMTVTADNRWPEVFVLGYLAASADAPGQLRCTLAFLGTASGLPGQPFVAEGAPISRVSLYSLREGEADAWESRADLDAAGAGERAVAFDGTTGVLTTGDGLHGALIRRASAVVATYDRTDGAGGNRARGASWYVPGADDEINRALVPGGFDLLAASLTITNPGPAEGGAVDDIAGAASRASESLWAHERLIEIAGARATLDQLQTEAVIERAAPSRAATLLDFERVTREVPGTAISRVRAWGGIDPRYACVRAAGTVTVVVMPHLPLGRPEPTAGLLAGVSQWLQRRRTLGTRLVVVGPEYVEVAVRATLRARPGARAERLVLSARVALDTFLDPVRGGPEGRGWPFGRDVYRTEVLQVLDNLPEVDHVVALELFTAGGEGCGNVCVGTIALVTPGTHEIEVI